MIDLSCLDRDARRLWIQFKARPSSRLRNRLVMHYLVLADRAGRMATGDAAVAACQDEGDLKQQAALILAELVEGYDPQRGVPFVQWASGMLRRRLCSHVRDRSFVKRAGQERGLRIRVASIDVPGVDDRGDRVDTIGERLAGRRTEPAVTAAEAELRAHVLARLPEDLRWFALNRYWRGWTLQRLAAAAGRGQSWSIATNRACQTCMARIMTELLDVPDRAPLMGVRVAA